MTIVQKLHHAARFRISPMFSLFAVSASGEYTLLEQDKSAAFIANEFVLSASHREHTGLEIRCDGVRVEL